MLEQLVVPIRSGYAWKVPAGHVFRIVTIEGPQVADLNIWNLHNPRERFWASRTRQLQQSACDTFDRLWSTLPYLRPLVTITDDSLADYGVDEHGGRVHDLLGTRCDPYVNRMLTGEDFDFHCHSNLMRADRAARSHRIRCARRTERVPGHRAQFRRSVFHERVSGEEWRLPGILRGDRSAVRDVDVPGGDLSVPIWGPDARDPIDVCRPLGVEVYSVDSRLLDGSKPPEVAVYGGAHGMRLERAGRSGIVRSGLLCSVPVVCPVNVAIWESRK